MCLVCDRIQETLEGKNRYFVKEFGIKHAPAYFRINSDGKILESPAASPENFEL